LTHLSFVVCDQALPQLAAVSNKTGKACRQINITSPEVITILQTLLGEVMDLFPGPMHHLGADEVSWSPEVTSIEKQ
jgi:N-acetyl-beta-hexosaminidase